MNPERLSRRRLLASVSAAVATATPAAATALGGLPASIAAASSDDPVFAAIENHKRLDAEVSRLSDALVDGEDEAAETYGDRPIALVLWRGYVIGGQEIEQRRRAYLAEGNRPKLSRGNTGRPKPHIAKS